MYVCEIHRVKITCGCFSTKCFENEGIGLGHINAEVCYQIVVYHVLCGYVCLGYPFRGG